MSESLKRSLLLNAYKITFNLRALKLRRVSQVLQDAV